MFYFERANEYFTILSTCTHTREPGNKSPNINMPINCQFRSDKARACPLVGLDASLRDTRILLGNNGGKSVYESLTVVFDAYLKLLINRDKRVCNRSASFNFNYGIDELVCLGFDWI